MKSALKKSLYLPVFFFIFSLTTVAQNDSHLEVDGEENDVSVTQLGIDSSNKSEATVKGKRQKVKIDQKQSVKQVVPAEKSFWIDILAPWLGIIVALLDLGQHMPTLIKVLKDWL